MINEIPIQMKTQRNAGIPVAAAIFAASECCVVSVEIKKRSFRLKNAFSRHWTVRKASAKFAHFKLAKRATASSPTHNIIPEKTVNSTLVNVTVDKRFQKGARSPKISVITPTKPAEIYNASRDE